MSYRDQGPISGMILFHLNSNSMEISFSFHLNCSKVIAIKFCTWHDSCAVVASEKCRNMTPYNGVTLKPIFHRICIMMENHS